MRYRVLTVLLFAAIVAFAFGLYSMDRDMSNTYFNQYGERQSNIFRWTPTPTP